MHKPGDTYPCAICNNPIEVHRDSGICQSCEQVGEVDPRYGVSIAELYLPRERARNGELSREVDALLSKAKMEREVS